ncbi:4-alpha-glucanotransferase, partial [Escherichia coli]|uniref:4-alpha-glucanotransferase n=1 Tax=Escherichia coli TaxID=562 RepID=UPI0013D14B5C
INLEAVAGKDFDAELKKLAVDRKKLNALTVVDYDAVIELKEKFLRTVYSKKGDEVLDSDDFKNYFDQNKHWLI